MPSSRAPFERGRWCCLQFKMNRIKGLKSRYIMYFLQPGPEGTLVQEAPKSFVLSLTVGVMPKSAWTHTVCETIVVSRVKCTLFRRFPAHPRLSAGALGPRALFALGVRRLIDNFIQMVLEPQDYLANGPPNHWKQNVRLIAISQYSCLTCFGDDSSADVSDFREILQH